MGKRKLLSTNFFQCEWTGYPLKNAHCYLPSRSQSNKLIKKGSYCNWESVVAHIEYMRAQDPEADFASALEHIEYITGTVVAPAPHFESLSHTKGRMDVLAFHEACSRQTGPISFVKIMPTGEIFEALATPTNGRFLFQDYLHQPYNKELAPSTFHSMRKKGSDKGTERDLSVWYYATKELPPNQTASNLFKMQLFGDVLLVQQSREASFLPRERFVSFTKEMFDDQFSKRKRGKIQETPSLTPAAYETLKQQMQASLNAYEQKASKFAAPPRETSKAATTGPSDGYTLAAKYRARCEKKELEKMVSPAVSTLAGW